MSARMTVIQTEHLSPQAATWLAERADLVVGDAESAAFAAAAPRAAALVVRTYTQVNDALLARLPALRAVGRAGVGLDNIDLDACARRGVLATQPGAPKSEIRDNANRRCIPSAP